MAEEGSVPEVVVHGPYRCGFCLEFSAKLQELRTHKKICPKNHKRQYKEKIINQLAMARARARAKVKAMAMIKLKELRIHIHRLPGPCTRPYVYPNAAEALKAEKRTPIPDVVLSEPALGSKVEMVKNKPQKKKKTIDPMYGKWECNVCFKKLSTQQAKENHIRSLHTKETPFACLICGQCFVSAPARSKHCKKEHPGMSTRELKKAKSAPL